ncbi:hypothetical protein E5983_00695 [Streptococcus danieliae]|uniref:Siphovirus Gp157 family protein n=1 Tax=Streptococcus danieliae TaxID=747656 RepID=A0A7X3G6T3_9STRE|nr:siphovirus Gp157 family protein [Streptococcus danieliae]MVX58192.1 hypothetical protein [Streptococcus danieliae]
MNLYELAEQYKFLYDFDFSEEEEDLWMAQLEVLDDAIELKADNIARLILDIEGMMEARKKEMERLKMANRIDENKIKRLKSYLQDAMERSDKRKFKTELFSFNIRKNAPSLLVESEENIPDEYFKEKTEIKLDKRELLADVKEGLIVDGVSLQRTESLVIR